MRTPLRVLACIATPLLVAGAVWMVSRPGDSPAAAHGVLVCDQEVDLGAVVADGRAEGIVPISNAGRGPLTITEVTTDCGCVGVRILPDGQEVSRSSSFVIPAGTQIRLGVSVRVAGLHGTRVGQLLRFRSDDPDHSAAEVRITYVPTARFFTDPTELNFGQTVAGHPVAGEIDVYTTDPQDAPPIRQATSTDPQRVRVRSVLASAGLPTSPVSGIPGARRLGRVGIELAALPAGVLLQEHVDVYIGDRPGPAIRIPVAARVAPEVEVVPTVAYLPRYSSSGPLYTTTCLCRSQSADPLAIVLGPLPDGVTVRVEDAGGASNSKRLVVECNPTRVPGHDLKVDLIAQLGEKKHPLELRVVIAPHE